MLQAFFIFMAIVWNIRVKLTEESEMVFKRRLRFVAFNRYIYIYIYTSQSPKPATITSQYIP